MAARIYKYTFRVDDTVTITMPKGAEILSVQTQDDVPTVWALVDPKAPPVSRLFHIFGTGHPIPGLFGPSSFVATFQQRDGAFVWHMFDAQKAQG